MFGVISRKPRIELNRFSRAIGSGVGMLLLASPAFAQIGGDRVSSFLSNALSYAQGLGIFGAGFLVIWAVANIARERPSGKQWAGACGALLLSSVDRKSTRLNSSHGYISYAVFCLKKKKNEDT